MNAEDKKAFLAYMEGMEADLEDRQLGSPTHFNPTHRDCECHNRNCELSFVTVGEDSQSRRILATTSVMQGRMLRRAAVSNLSARVRLDQHQIHGQTSW